MFVIHTRVLDEKAAIVSTGVVAGHFEERQAAELHLDNLIEQSKPNAGHDSKRYVWWVRESGTVTLYTIVP